MPTPTVSKVHGIKGRIKIGKFKYHVSESQLCYNSLSEVGKSHIQTALSFELDHCDYLITCERMAQRLADIDLTLAHAETVDGGV